MCDKTRRGFLKAGAAVAAGATVLHGNSLFAFGGETPAPGQTRLSQFEYADVQLLEGPMLEQFQQNVSLFSASPTTTCSSHSGNWSRFAHPEYELPKL
jgi:hypothetical protein